VTAPLLVFGWGNRSRGDDALGPAFVDRLRALAGDAGEARVAFLEDYQLQAEHALDLAGRARVLFVDASLACAAPFAVTKLRAARDASFTTHAMSPAAVMQVYRDVYRAEPPPCTLLAIRGERFELGEPPAPPALENLALAVDWGLRWLASDPAPDPAGFPAETVHA
jgi:hydrogenase maturation protease